MQWNNKDAPWRTDIAFSIFTMAMLLFGSFVSDGLAADPAYTLDYRYAPPQWRSSICLVDDWQKTQVVHDGALLYDFGASPHIWDGFGTKVYLDFDEPVSISSQQLYNARVPIVSTIKICGAIQIVEEAFAAAGSAQFSLQRLGAATGNASWASPSIPADSGFRNVAVGWNEPVVYRFKADDDASYEVVFGLCEGYYSVSGQRILDLQIEGQTRLNIDMVAAKGGNVPAVFSFTASDQDGDGWITITSAAAAGSPDVNSILNCLWVFPAGALPNLDDVLLGKYNSKALCYVDCIKSVCNSRNDILLVRLRNIGTDAQTVHPKIVVESTLPISVAANQITVDNRTDITCTMPLTGIDQPSGKAIFCRGATTLQPGQETDWVVDIATGSPRLPLVNNTEAAHAERKKTIAYWENVNLPYGHITVPDKDIQALLESSIRNIYQAREIKNGLPAFQVGPGVYRGMWVVDGAFLTESVSLLGRIQEARAGIEYLLSFQKPDGAFEIIANHWKETGIMLWVMYRHARLTQDKAWLNKVWPKLEKCVSYIQYMRDEVCSDPGMPNYRLIPDGFSDGGLGGVYPEYTNIYWNLIGIRAAVNAADWLGKTSQKQAWQAEYDDFYQTFRAAAARDTKLDQYGNAHIPIRMIDDKNVKPQKAQWAFLHSVYPGGLYADDDPLVVGNMNFLSALENEGLIFGTGWLGKGLWTYFGSFYAHAWLWMGESQKAAETLYAFGNHAGRLMVWREEQMPQGNGDGRVGDMPHNWASAEFIRLVRHLLVLERGNELHLLEGLPAAWIYPGARLELKDIITEFGSMSLELAVNAAGDSADLHVVLPQSDPPVRSVLHLANWSGDERCIKLEGNEVRLAVRLAD